MVLAIYNGMKTTNLEKIRQELENGFGKKCMRNGIEYGWYNAAALDAGIETRAKNARKWRQAVLDLAENGKVTERKVTLKLEYVKRFRPIKATAYYLDGELKLYVYRGKFLTIDSYIEV